MPYTEELRFPSTVWSDSRFAELLASYASWRGPRSKWAFLDKSCPAQAQVIIFVGRDFVARARERGSPITRIVPLSWVRRAEVEYGHGWPKQAMFSPAYSPKMWLHEHIWCGMGARAEANQFRSSGRQDLWCE